jgi:hypothetical protein
LKKLSINFEPAKFNSLIQKAEQLESAVQSLNENKEKVLSHQIREEEKAIDLINEASIKVCRALSPILWTEAGRYDQDPYGYYLVGKPIPRLYIPILEIDKSGDSLEEFNLWETKFIRERNKVSDAISKAAECIILTNRLLEHLK